MTVPELGIVPIVNASVLLVAVPFATLIAIPPGTFKPGKLSGIITCNAPEPSWRRRERSAVGVHLASGQ